MESAAFLNVWERNRGKALLILSQMSSAQRAQTLQALPDIDRGAAWHAAIERRIAETAGATRHDASIIE